MKIKESLLGCMLAICASNVQAQVAPRPIVIDDIYRVAALSDPQVSPDGQWVAYIVTLNDRGADETRSSLWMASFDGKQRFVLTGTVDDLDKPRFSPDGRYLSYLTSTEGRHGVLMLLDRRGGNARPLADNVAEINDYAWAPDGKSLALIRQSPEAEKPAPIVIDALHFKQDAEGYLSEASKRHLSVFDLATRQSTSIAEMYAEEEMPAFSPDGKLLAFVRTRENGPDQDGQEDIDIVDLRSGTAARRIARPFAPNVQRLSFSPDGKWLAYLQGREPKLNAYMQDRLFVVPSGGGEPRALTDSLDRAVMSYAFLDAARIAIAIEADGSVYPALLDVTGGAIERTKTRPTFVVSALSAAAGHAVLLKADDASFAELFAWEGGQFRKLSDHNDALLKDLKLGAVEPIAFKSGTLDVHALLVKPPAFEAGKKYPLLLWIHGGPNEQVEHSLALDGYLFEPQVFAARGYLVLQVNYRGSSGRGLAYATSILADWGHKEVQDLLAGVDHLTATGMADGDRLAIGGWSYGALLTDYVIASDTRFKAAIAGAGSGNQLSTYGADQYILQYNHELGPPWKNAALWLKVSYPFFHAERIRTPTLFLGGAQDFNVPIIGGEQMYEALRTLGVPARLVVYPGEHHVFTRPSFIVDLDVRMSDWLRSHMP